MIKCHQCGSDNPDNAAMCMNCGAHLTPQEPLIAQPVGKPGAPGIAIAALVFGILGFPTCGLGGVAAIILGIIALLQISKSNGEIGGRNMAIAGLVLGGISIILLPFIAILAAILFPVFAKARGASSKTHCMNNMKQLGTALNVYFTDYDGMLPNSGIGSAGASADTAAFATGNMVTGGTWANLLQPMMKNKDIFYCPSDPNNSNSGAAVSYWWKAAVDRSAWGATVNAASYTGVREGDFESPSDQVVFYECKSFHWEPGSVWKNGLQMNMAFADGHAATKRLANFGAGPDPVAVGEPAYFNQLVSSGAVVAPSATTYDVKLYADKLN